MQRIPIRIDAIRVVDERNREIEANFQYSFGSGPETEFVQEHVILESPHYFIAIAGKTFDKCAIDDWVRAHDGRWSAATFLQDKIMDLSAPGGPESR